jgi:Arc/MetJ-type ribon-helix-helix transcriptional regulator
MLVPKTKDKMVLVTIRITKQMLEEINELVASGKYPSMSEFIRYAIHDLLNNLRGLANQVATTTNPQPQAQPQETHQAQQQQHVRMDLEVVKNAQ